VRWAGRPILRCQDAGADRAATVRSRWHDVSALLVRQDILAGLSDFASANGRSVFISSHQVADIERICDRIIFLHHGRVLLDDTVQNIKESRREVRAVFPNGVPDDLDLGDAAPLQKDQRTLACYCRGDADDVRQRLEERGASTEETPLDLETIFRHEVRR